MWLDCSNNLFISRINSIKTLGCSLLTFIHWNHWRTLAIPLRLSVMLHAKMKCLLIVVILHDLLQQFEVLRFRVEFHCIHCKLIEIFTTECIKIIPLCPLCDMISNYLHFVTSNEPLCSTCFDGTSKVTDKGIISYI